ncbi:MAG: SHOCT domain-containing protein [Actinomycetota bacterium]|nr:SHOCT domain-containing protein [Actinomycetota bacterium]
MMHYGFPGGGAMVWAGFLFMLVFWVLIVAGVVALVTWVGKQGRQAAPPSEDPIGALKMRYAKGELTKEEFESMRKDLAG